MTPQWILNLILFVAASALSVALFKFSQKQSIQATWFVFASIVLVSLFVTLNVQDWIKRQNDIRNPPKQNTEAFDSAKQQSESALETKSQQDQNTAKNFPDLSKATQTLLNSTNQFEPISNTEIKDVSTIVKGFFEILAGPAPDQVYSYPQVNTKNTFSTHVYASIRMAGMENIHTIDFMCRDAWVVIIPTWNKYMIYESEQSQTIWRDIPVKIDPILNTVGIYQNGRKIDVFINNQYVDSFTKIISPKPGPLTIAAKASKDKGGKMFFRDLSVWEFKNEKR